MFEVLEASIQNNNDIISQITVDKKKRVVITPALVQQIKNFQSVKNDDFMRSYYETQSNWLNMWLTILTIVLGILAVVLPVCFMKFYEDKKKDIEKVIRECKKVQKSMMKEVATVEKKKNSMTADLELVKKYVDDSKANNFYAQAISDLSKNNYDDALDNIEKTIKLNPKMEKAYGIKSIVYRNKQDYNKALECLNQAIQLLSLIHI